MNNKAKISSHFTNGFIQNKTQFVNFIRDRLGINIHSHQEKSLEKTIESACTKFQLTPEEYFSTLLISTDESPELEFLVLGITVGETYFFRDKSQVELLQNKILPELIRSKRNKNDFSLRIWSAGCASGEEIYTVAMLLRESLKDIQNWSINLLATDINTGSLQKGIIGHYGQWSMRSIPDYFKKNYFTQKDKEYVLVNKLNEMVNFSYLNLKDDSYPSIFTGTNSQDLIVCRNVLIYFDNEHIAQVMRKFSECLTVQGYLLLGASDPVFMKDTDLTFNHAEGMLFTKSNLTEAEIAPLVKATPIPKKTITINNAPSLKIVSAVPKISVKDFKEMIISLLSKAKWQEVLNQILLCTDPKVSKSFLLTSKATALANLGKLQIAADLCRESLILDPTDKSAYFTYALILIELNQLSEAEMILKKTLFLDREFVPGHFQLGLLLLRNKKITLGIKSLSNALTISQGKNLDEVVIGSNGITYRQLVEILKQEIELYTLTGTGNKDYADENS